MIIVKVGASKSGLGNDVVTAMKEVKQLFFASSTANRDRMPLISVLSVQQRQKESSPLTSQFSCDCQH